MLYKGVKMKIIERVSYIILKNSVSVNLKPEGGFGETYSMDNDCVNYGTLIQALKEKKYQDVVKLLDASATLSNMTDGFVFKNGAVLYEGERIGSYLESRVLEFAQNNLPYEHLANFWCRLRKNPSKNSVEQLYRFLEKARCPITKDGTFIAYKSVRKEKDRMVSHHDGETVHAIGIPVSMLRDKVVDDPSQACGPGLHVGSYEYAQGFGGNNSIILEMEVDPADVVSVPTDCSSGKCRCASYIPRAFLVREYNSPIVIDEAHVELEGYEIELIDSAVFAAINNQKLFPGKLKPQIMPDKLPAVIAAFGKVEEAYKDVDADMYYVKYTMPDGRTECYIVSRPVEQPEIVYVQEVENACASISIVPAVEPEELVVEAVSVTEEVYPYIFKGDKYYREEVTQEQFAVASQRDTVIKIRASKVPSMVKNEDVKVCYREDVGTETVFYVKIGDLFYKYAIVV